MDNKTELIAMIPEIALIRSGHPGYDYNKKICGLYPLERNILILSKTGIKKIYLDLSKEEKSFYDKKIAKHLKRLDIGIIFFKGKGLPSPYLSVPSNLFTQVHYFKEFTDYFDKRNKNYRPKIKDDQFLLFNDEDYRNSTEQAAKYIIQNTGGFIAQKINKRLSIPISLRLANTRIHPNYLTAVNMAVGLLSGIFLLFNSYWHIAFGGFLFQLASVMDGIDGEVAKFTFKVSKIGGWLDTIGDNLTLIFFLAACSYLYYVNTTGFLSLSVIGLAFAGLAAMIITMVRYLKRYSESGSLVAYDREFLQNLPKSDVFVSAAKRLKYITKKEFFSIVFFIICISGKAYLIIPVIAMVFSIASVILITLDVKYLKTFAKV